MSRQDQIEAFLMSRGATKCPPSKRQARSLQAMRREHEESLTEKFAAKESAA